MIYVSAAASGAGNGASWADAYVDLQDALGTAQPGDEIWVAAGTYKPDRSTGDRLMSFELVSDVGLYGGFSGHEHCRDERDPQANLTILSGDLLGNDDPSFTPISNCCFSRPHELGCDDAACAETVDTHLSYEACLTGGWADVCAGGAEFLCCDLCAAPRCDNSFRVVRATNVDGSAVLSGFEIRAAEANGYPDQPSWGGGLILKDSELTVEGCRFADNVALNAAAILEESDYGVPTIRGCTFERNRTFGGAVVDSGWPSQTGMVIRDCVFRNNYGTGLDAVSASPIENVVFIENAGFGLLNREPLTIKGCAFIRNGVGGLSAADRAYVIDCEFIGNTHFGGILGGSSLTVVNSLFVGNVGGAISGGMGGTDIVSSVFVANVHPWARTGGIYFNSAGRVRNSIFWGNNGAYGTLEEMQLYQTDPFSSLLVDNSIIEGWTGSYGGVGNSGADPLFVDADGADDIPGTEDDDLRLLPGSPAIDAGDPDETYLLETDLDGHARVLCGRVDIGVYESGIGDYDCNQTVDLTDFAAWEACMTGPSSTLTPGPSSLCLPFDFNADGAIDLRDFSLFILTLAAP